MFSFLANSLIVNFGLFYASLQNKRILLLVYAVYSMIEAPALIALSRGNSELNQAIFVLMIASAFLAVLQSDMIKRKMHLNQCVESPSSPHLYSKHNLLYPMTEKTPAYSIR